LLGASTPLTIEAARWPTMLRHMTSILLRDLVPLGTHRRHRTVRATYVIILYFVYNYQRWCRGWHDRSTSPLICL